MKPIELSIEAFGPFAEKEIIDFKKYEEGLFLITGDTGAGKTTIFDAMTFALYGEASGNNRKATMLRSDFAKNDMVTRVSLKFAYGRKCYLVTRTPQYERGSLRGDKTVTQKGDATLYLCQDGVASKKKGNGILEDGENHVVATGFRGVTDKVTEILGINREQFVNVSMIAQGEFLKLLLAKSKERSEIFRDIFNTKIYEHLKLALRDRAKQKKEDLERCIQARILYAKDGDYSDFPEEKAKEYKRLLEEGNVQVLPELVQDIGDACINDREKLSELKVKKNKIDKEYEKISEQLAKEEERRKTFSDHKKEYEKWIREKEETLKLLDAAKEKRNNAKEKKEEADRLLGQASVIESTFPRYEELQRQREEEAKRQKELKEAEKQVHVAKKTLDDWAKEQEKKQKELNKIVQAFEEKEQEKKQASTEYDTMLAAFLRNQAGIMASGLVEGMPCPVCGSTHHPKKQEMTEAVCSEEDIEGAKKKRDRLEQELSELSNRIGERRKDLEASSKEEQQLRNSLQESQQRENEQKLLLAQVSENIRISEEHLAYKTLREAEAARKKCLDEVSRIEKQQKKAKEEVGKHTVSLKALEENITKREEWLKKKEKDLGDLEELSEKRRVLLAEKRELEGKERTLGERFRRNTEVLEKLQASNEEYDKKNRDWETYDDLSRTANGVGYRSGKLDFESYVQAAYFEQIIALANIRLGKMTSGRFELLRRKEADSKASHTGLELDVLDNNTGKVRRGETLSGGEAFMASLSMALGMSDVIVSTSGGVRMDAMFIDEGFGSLDSNTMERALEILTELGNSADGANGKKAIGTNRMIGIISHVELLKERIDKKITVERGIAGSKIHSQ